MVIKFIVPGIPVPKARPRVTKFGTYTPKQTVQYERSVRIACKTAASGKSFREGTPISVTVRAYFPIPSTLSKKRRIAMVGTPHLKHRGDLDNVVKSVLDALNGVAFADDCAVWSIYAEKRYAETPRTEVTLMDRFDGGE